MANYDAPEIAGHCAIEHALALRARQRLAELLRGTFTLQRVSCWHGYARDRYGRRCAIVRVDGRDVGDVLIAEKLAVSFPQPYRARPWCLHARAGGHFLDGFWLRQTTNLAIEPDAGVNCAGLRSCFETTGAIR
jgi:endonuclease YncB( thermonuclease family)